MNKHYLILDNQLFITAGKVAYDSENISDGYYVYSYDLSNGQYKLFSLEAVLEYHGLSNMAIIPAYIEDGTLVNENFTVVNDKYIIVLTKDIIRPSNYITLNYHQQCLYGTITIKDQYQRLVYNGKLRDLLRSNIKLPPNSHPLYEFEHFGKINALPDHTFELTCI